MAAAVARVTRDGCDPVILGVDEPPAVGPRGERLVEESPASLLIVRAAATAW